MADVANLRNDHAEIVRIVRRLAEMIARPSPPPQVELFNLRRELSSALIAHLKAEDWVLYPRLMESGDPRVAAVANAFSDEMGGLSAAFVAYNGKWGAAAIEANWAGYRTETQSMIEALTSRITRENRELYPLLEALEKAA
jgi:hypothetical protein